MENKTATKAYIEKINSIEELLEAVKTKIFVDGVDCRKANWANVGDLGHVEEQLKDIAEFLNV